MILLFGFNTSRRDELPVKIVSVADGAAAVDTAQKMAQEFPRVGRLDHPMLRTVKNYQPLPVKEAKKEPKK